MIILHLFYVIYSTQHKDRHLHDLSFPQENTAVIQSNNQWLAFTDPIEIISTHDPAEIPALLRKVETAVSKKNLQSAGMMSYEASSAFSLTTNQPSNLPLLWFGLYKKVSPITPPHFDTAAAFSDWQANTDWPAYQNAINQIKSAIAKGDTYQVNYTMQLNAPFVGSGWPLFWQLVQAQQANYTAYLNIGGYEICSASPELFFKLDGTQITSKPMKGTARRGLTFAEDMQLAQALHLSEKNRAENVMIVDMIRNDMGRICDIGTVKVPQLFEIERYPTVLQMTSTVTGQTGASFGDIMAAMFPCASITGAPKVRTMELIAELEPAPRGIYTGTIGYLLPNRQAQFNVAIRTVVLDKAAQQASYGVGGGIVWDSVADAEYEECQLKAQVLMTGKNVANKSVTLLESLLWEPESGYFLLDAHLSRLAESAVYFGIGMDKTAVSHRLHTFATTLHSAQKVRLLLSSAGDIVVEATPLGETDHKNNAVGLATFPVDSQNRYLYHKTTRREIYAKAQASRPDCEEVILWNERGEITETDRANVVIEYEGELITPPVSAGLLAGTFRGWLLENGRIQERTITKEMLAACDQIYLINSVRKWRKGQLVKRTFGTIHAIPTDDFSPEN